MLGAKNPEKQKVASIVHGIFIFFKVCLFISFALYLPLLSKDCCSPATIQTAPDEEDSRWKL